MPTYDYECRKCGHRFELFHSISDETPKKCPKCKARARRVPSAGAGLLFKGSGFYITDYRSQSYRDKAKQETSGGAGASKDASSAGGASGSSGGESAGGAGGSGAKDSSSTSRSSERSEGSKETKRSDRPRGSSAAGRRSGSKRTRDA